ncbi:hypothetical protein YTPLAS18_12310 [Nitrospira sp.]|nr:hypothetical protein YTPLAS18_12310 [Nitrospira sp.]
MRLRRNGTYEQDAGWNWAYWPRLPAGSGRVRDRRGRDAADIRRLIDDDRRWDNLRCALGFTESLSGTDPEWLERRRTDGG